MRAPRSNSLDGGSCIATVRIAIVRRSQPTDGGARRDRTDDLLLAKQALSQLSYGPEIVGTA